MLLYSRGIICLAGNIFWYTFRGRVFFLVKRTGGYLYRPIKIILVYLHLLTFR